MAVPEYLDITHSFPDDLTISFAAEELKKYLFLACGLRARILHIADERNSHIRLGLCDAGEMGGEEAFTIEIFHGRIALLGGTPRAVLYAVYAFLEEYLGIRWFYPGEDIVPRHSPEFFDSVLKSTVHRTFRPDFAIRMRRFLVYDLGEAGTPLAEPVMSALPAEADWMAKNRMNIFQFALDHNWNTLDHWRRFRKHIPEFSKRAITVGVGGHCAFMFIDPEGNEGNPGWYPSLKRRPTGEDMFCTRNEEAVAHYVDNMERFLEENPEVGYLAPWPNDNAIWCECEKCRGDSVANRYLEFNNRVFKQLRSSSPVLRMTHFAYQTHLDPPEETVPESRLSVTVCTWGRDLSIPFSDERTPVRFKDALESWRKITARNGAGLVLHEKYARHLGFGPQPLPVPILRQDLEDLKSRDLHGVELPMAYMGRWVKGLNYYVIARLLWDTTSDEKELIRDHFTSYYGPIAAEVRQACELLSNSLDDWRYWDSNSVQRALKLTPGDVIPDDLRIHCTQVVEGIQKAMEIIKDCLARAQPQGAAYIARAGKLLALLDYCHTEWMALDALCEGDSALRKNNRELARAKFREAVKLSEKRDAVASDPCSLDIAWDATGAGPYGVLPLAGCSEWLKLVE